MKIRTNKFAAAALAGALAFGVAACENTEEGMEQDAQDAEQEMDEGAEDMDDGMDDAESDLEDEVVDEANEDE